MAAEPKKKGTVSELGELVCECGAKTFTYEESVPVGRTMAGNDNGRLTFWSDFNWYDGDDEPGVVCTACEEPVQVPSEIELDWR